MNRCSIQLENGQPCNMPTIVFYEEYGEYICLDHAPQHYRPGDMVNLHDTPRDGYVLALGQRRGMITRPVSYTHLTLPTILLV